MTRCPECFSERFSVTLIGFLSPDGHRHDPNRRTCEACNHAWYEKCTTCGWSGAPVEIPDADRCDGKRAVPGMPGYSLRCTLSRNHDGGYEYA